jgi:hypothetical protein
VLPYARREAWKGIPAWVLLGSHRACIVSAPGDTGARRAAG